MNHNQMTSQLPGVDIVKYLMAYCVVAIHFRANYWEVDRDGFDYPFWFDWMIKLAVPFFFMVSGYLLQRKLDFIADKREQRKVVFQRCRRIARMWMLWNIIYVPLTVYYFYYYDVAPRDAVVLFIKMMLLNGGIYGAIPLWYLYSLLWVTLAIGINLRSGHYRR